MKRALLALICLAVLAIGCQKNKQNTEVPQAEPALADAADAKKPSDIAGKEVATGDLKELLLILQRVHFPFDSNTLVDDAKKALEEAAQKLNDHQEVALWVEGHTDDRGTTEYNMSLGERRAKTVVDYLRGLGVAAERLSVTSLGEEQPLQAGGGEMVHAQNRRVEFRLMRGNIQLVLEEGTLVNDKGQRLGKTAPAPAAAPEAKPNETAAQ